MPFGKFKGQPVDDMETTYLLWIATQAHIRYKYPESIFHALEVLRGRFEDFDTLLGELEQNSPPPEYWKAKRQARREKENRRIAYALIKYQ